MLALILLAALFSFGNISRIAMSHPVARAAMLLFAIVFAAMFYGLTPFNDAFVILGKYVDLAFIPIFIFILSNGIIRRRARFAFITAMAITLLASYLIGLEIIPVMPWMHPWTEPSNPAIFHSHITQNNMMAFAIFLAMLEFREAATRTIRTMWGAFVLLAVGNMLFMVQGRTGSLILLALIGFFLWSSLSRYMFARKKKWGSLQQFLIVFGLFVIALIAYHTSARLHDRFAMVVAEYQVWTPDHGKDTSTGQRLDFYSNTLYIIRDHVLFGVGTGGFPAAFEAQAQGKNIMITHNPHNEYLMITVQTGIIGLVLLLNLFYMHWRYAPLLPTSFEQDAARGLLIAYMINCMLNSALMDHSDGLFFAFMTAVLFSNLKLGTKHD
jgi:O-antigen ligase